MDPMLSTTTRPKAYSYLRFSTPEQMKGDSLRRQTDLATLYAARHGLDLDTSTFQDLGVSAFSGDNARTGALFKFQQFVYEGVIPAGSYLLVESLDRLSRSDIVEAQGLLMSIIGRGITVVTLQQGAERVYSREALRANPHELIIAIVEMMRAHGESATKAARLKEAWQAKRSRLGTVNLTSIAPAWLKARPAKNGFDVIPDRADVVRRMFLDYLGGVGLESIASRLNQAAVKPWGRGTFWRRSYVAKIIVNPAVIGVFVPHTDQRVNGRTVRTPCEPVLGYFPPILDEEAFHAAQAMKQKAGREATARPRSGGVRHLLAGLAVCPLCGASMSRITKGSRTKAGHPYLVCSRAKQGAGCVYKAVRVKDVDAAITIGASFVVGTAPSGQSGLDQEWQATQDQRDAVDAAMDNLLDALGHGGESRPIRQRLDILQADRDLLTKRLALLAEQIGTSSSIFVGKALDDLQRTITGDIETLDIPKANAALRRVLKSVTVDYPNGELEFAWAQGGETRLTYGWPLE
ncbi:recombinase family protein [Variovorax sp. PAMC26660]|uniref:recombinase family protein n=1 Tax=Variovorax sp. PAMC26660 TaxID=2762322 RepID=UPI00164DBB67|nr:recombinase family protein [Variovorax sp. PAMC26660]QNK70557.1 recombinase family protein [Variovorax sp. PAMC26660]